MSRYEMLVRVLDGIRAESDGRKFDSLYANGSIRTEDVWQARSRAYVHLYLKVMFGITDFNDRETYVTDGGLDGGIDGYFIDNKSKTVFLIQSKFRRTEDNFERKPIEINEILSMQIKRVLNGEEFDEDGNKYNGKISGLQRRVSEIPDLGRYSYRVVIIANLRKVSDDAIRRLTDGFDSEIIDFQRSYKELLYPVISGTLFKSSGMNISLDLSNKSAGTKIGYSVSTSDYECEITVVFVPTIEIAKAMSHYRNSILLYNPRSYLEFEGEKVNSEIKSTIVSSDVNDFALLNNGITIVCDESGINEQSGRKHRAQLFLLNPQIINGGQTAYTLSRIFDDLAPDKREKMFSGKEVLVKAIALTNHADVIDDERKRISLIEKISMATNSQSVITLADRTSGDPLHSQIQSALFERYGLLYERKRGEFSDGLRSGYISAEEVINRTTFTRLYLVSNGNLANSLKRRIAAVPLGSNVATDQSKLDRFIIALSAFRFFSYGKDKIGQRRYASILPKIYAVSIVAKHLEEGTENQGQVAAMWVQKKWPSFLSFAAANDAKYVRMNVDARTGEQIPWLLESRRVFGKEFQCHADRFFGSSTFQFELNMFSSGAPIG
jgi:hypothetical protein